MRKIFIAFCIIVLSLNLLSCSRQIDLSSATSTEPTTNPNNFPMPSDNTVQPTIVESSIPPTPTDNPSMVPNKDDTIQENENTDISSDNVIRMAIIPEDKEYNDLSEEEKEKYNKISQALKNEIEYRVNIIDGKAEIIYDLNNDGKLETLMYSNDGISSEVRLPVDADEGVSYIGLLDADLNDNYVECNIAYCDEGVGNFLYNFTGDGIDEIGTFAGEIQAYSNDGKIFFWGGNLFEDYPNSRLFNKDTVLIYFDINEHKLVKTDQIIGKTITAESKIILYNNKEDVIYGTIPDEERFKLAKENHLLILNEGDKFTVLSIDGLIDSYEFENQIIYYNNDIGVKIQTEDGNVGYIGGFHTTWF